MAADRKAAAAKGGRAPWRRLMSEGNPLPAESPTAGVLEYLAEIMEAARDATLTSDDVARFRLGAYAASVAAHVLKTAETAQVVADLEKLRQAVEQLERNGGRVVAPWERSERAVQ